MKIIRINAVWCSACISMHKVWKDIEKNYPEIEMISYDYDNNGNITERTDSYINVLVSPDKLHDLLELAACYSAKPSKSFTNYNANNIFVFDKTILLSTALYPSCAQDTPSYEQAIHNTCG